VATPPDSGFCGSLPVEEATVITKFVSGGQTGVDRAALDAAMLQGIPHGGWCPPGRRAGDGTIPMTYLLQETGSADYSQRTEQNVRNSDGMLIVTGGPVTGGTALTRCLAKQIGSPVRLIDLREDAGFEEVEEWLLANRISILQCGRPARKPTAGHPETSRRVAEHAACMAPQAGPRHGPKGTCRRPWNRIISRPHNGT